MVLYNVTVAVDASIHEDWLTWMQEEHIPAVMATAMFIESRIFKVLLEKEESITYAVQYSANSIADLQQYLARYAPQLQQEVLDRYPDKIVAFRTVLEEIK
jgi:hypothetical protein